MAAKEAQKAKNAAVSAVAAPPPAAAAVPAAKLKAEVKEMQQRLKSLKEAVEDRDSPKIGKDERLRKSNVVKDEDDEDVMEDENLEDGNEDGEEYPDYPDQPTFRSVSCLFWTFFFYSEHPSIVSSVSDPWRFGTNPDPRILTTRFESDPDPALFFSGFLFFAFTSCA
jgi:hypothetical protein